MGQNTFASARLVYVVAALGAVVGTLELGCGRASEAERRASDEATALAEEMAEETTLTSATVEAGANEHANGEPANAEIVAAFRLEQSDYRQRLQQALDHLDTSIAHRHGASRLRVARTRELRARRALLKEDLIAVNRSTEPDWATLRARVERHLRQGPSVPR